MNPTAQPPSGPSRAWVEAYRRDGCVLVPALFSAAEIAELRARFETIWTDGVPGFFERRGSTYLNSCEGDYPRIVHPHRFDALSRRTLLEPRLMDAVGALLADEPVAAQTMYYWKPPGTKGQAPHQDNLYLQAEDAEGCLAAWIAVDACDEENGCLVVVPGSQALELQCPETADAGVSFTSHHVRTPEGLDERPIVMSPGDVLFFGGKTIHGSGPNRSAERCRRSFICHYIGARSTKSAGFYNPLIRRDGVEFDNDASDFGDPCGVAFAGPH